MTTSKILSIGLAVSLGWLLVSSATMILMLQATMLDRILDLARLFLYAVAGTLLFLILSKAVKNNVKQQILVKLLFVAVILDAIVTLYLMWLAITSVYTLPNDPFITTALLTTIGNSIILFVTLLITLASGRPKPRIDTADPRKS